MKKLNLAVAFALSLAAPFGAMAASDDATIRAMGMNDNAAAAVMKDIAISDNANERARTQVALAEQNRNRDRAREHLELEDDNEVVENAEESGGGEDPDTGSGDDLVQRIR